MKNWKVLHIATKKTNQNTSLIVAQHSYHNLLYVYNNQNILFDSVKIQKSLGRYNPKQLQNIIYLYNIINSLYNIAVLSFTFSFPVYRCTCGRSP